MAKKGKWTVVFEDKIIIKNCDEFSNEGYGFTFAESDYDSLWNDSKFSNVWAFQWSDDNDKDQVEYRDNTRNSSYDENVFGNFTTQFKNIWDAKYLVELQTNWDNNNVSGETSDEKITRLGARPTSYTSL
mgnify:CR=1 FL=1|tara:strand:+ start:4065 stop:4454 length:390 start_codon:yes stop_codon:yes gene_type:complete